MKRLTAAIGVAVLLAGCASDPLGDVPRLSDTDVADSDIQAAIRAEPENAEVVVEEMNVATPAPRQGFFGRLLGGGATAAPEPEAPAMAEQTEIALVESPNEVSAPAPAPVQRGGLLGFLQRAADDAQNEAPDTQVATAVAPAQTLGGLFGRNTAAGPKPGAPDFQTVSMGTTLPYGVLARVCDARPRQMGKRVERYPDGGNAYALYDSEPGNTAPHTYYLTGFDDGCARQFTAALALFGSPQTHEQLRYGLPSKVQPYSDTDAAYERLKSRICRVGRSKPCGSAMNRMARNTAFVSVYERFGSNPVWKTILLHNGEVVETDIRSN